MGNYIVFQVLAATQTPGTEGKRWFQGTADAVRQFDWLFDVCIALRLSDVLNACFAFWI
jgi:glucose-1-phosphate adenylyltransferase